MNTTLKIQAFEYLISKLLEWQSSQSNLEKNNDLSILKVLKLTFFVSAVGTKSDTQNSLLDGVFDNYVAMPYGHVESDIYSYIKNNLLTHYQINNRETIQKKLYTPETLDDLFIKIEIDNAVSLLKKINNNLIKMSSFDLVDLSHTWYSWQKYFSIAQEKGVNSINIPIQEIKSEDKIYQL